MKKKPNIVLIVTDEMRGDCMGVAGHPDVKTPYLDTLANNGILYENAYSACPSCVPARANLLTGLSQKHTGRVGYQDCVDWNYPNTLAGELSKNGYYTQAVGKMHVYPSRNYMGFHHVELHDGYMHHSRKPNSPYAQSQVVVDDYFYWLKEQKGVSCDITDTGLDCNSWMARPWIYEEKYHPTNWATDRAIDFLRRRDPRQPFFLMLSYVRPHAPYDAPQHYFDLYKDKELTAPVKGDWNNTEDLKKQGRTFNNNTGPLDPELIRQQQVGYYACITHVDHQIGRFLLAMIEQDLYDDTVFIFTSDHGEMLSDHCLCRKSRAYQGSIHIPMIVSGKEEYIGKKNKGSVSDSLVELRDIMPTFLRVTKSKTDASLDGLDMTSEEIEKRTYIHGEHTAGDYSSHFIVSKTDKFVWYSQTGVERYFDLINDENETHDAINDEKHQERIRFLKSILIAELEGREEGFVENGELVVGKDISPVLQSVLDSFKNEE